MKTWNVYRWADWLLVDVVTSSDNKESHEVKAAWFRRSFTASAMRDVDERVAESDFMVCEPDHFE